jgi:hypothetical protein
MRALSPRAIAIGAAGVTALVALVVFLVVMADAELRRTGTNALVVPTHAEVPPGGELCQENVRVPAGSRHAAPWVGGPDGADGGPVAVELTQGGRVLARGRSPERYPTGITRMRLDRTIERGVDGAALCLENRGEETLFVYGDFPPPGVQPAVAPGGAPTLIRLDWYGDAPESWWELLPAIADRFPLVKAGFLGEWALWLCLAVPLGLVALALRRVLREAA